MSRVGIRIAGVVLAGFATCLPWLGTPRCAAQVPLEAGSPASNHWTLRVLSPVTVSSPIVRLGDVVQPLDSQMPQWDRLRHAPIGLLPLNSQPMRIQRDRLHRAIRDATAQSPVIDWVGPAEIEVQYRRDQPNASVERSVTVVPSGSGGSVRTASYEAPDAGNGDQREPRDGTQRELRDGTQREMSDSEVERITHWVMLAVDRQHPELARRFRVELADDRSALSSLARISGVTDLEPLVEPQAGNCPVRLVARRFDGPVESQLLLKLTPHPEVAVVTKVLPRGHRLTSQDLELQPIPEQELEPSHIRDPQEVLGMEVRNGVRPGQPLDRSNLRTPIVVHRGDLIEVRVMGGGVVVTTNAKALSDGSAADLIEIETLDPRKRLLARVVQSGLVEIVTRAPKVHP